MTNLTISDQARKNLLDRLKEVDADDNQTVNKSIYVGGVKRPNPQFIKQLRAAEKQKSLAEKILNEQQTIKEVMEKRRQILKEKSIWAKEKAMNAADVELKTLLKGLVSVRRCPSYLMLVFSSSKLCGKGVEILESNGLKAGKWEASQQNRSVIESPLDLLHPVITWMPLSTSIECLRNQYPGSSHIRIDFKAHLTKSTGNVFFATKNEAVKAFFQTEGMNIAKEPVDLAFAPSKRPEMSDHKKEEVKVVLKQGTSDDQCDSSHRNSNANEPSLDLLHIIATWMPLFTPILNFCAGCFQKASRIVIFSKSDSHSSTGHLYFNNETDAVNAFYQGKEMQIGESLWI